MNETINAEKKANIGNVKIRSISINKQAHIEKFYPEPSFDGWHCPFCGERVDDSLTGHFHSTDPVSISGTIEVYDSLPVDRYRDICFILDNMKIFFGYFVIIGEMDKDIPRIISSDKRDVKTIVYGYTAGRYYATLEEEL